MKFLKQLANRIQRGEPIVKALNQLSTHDLRLHTVRPAYEDLRFPASAINPPGAAEDPDFDTTNCGWLFDPGATEVLYVLAQIPHAWKEGTTLKPHVHWEKTTSAAGAVRWQLRYEWASYYEARTSLTTINATTPVADSDTADVHLITPLPTIAGTGRQISDMLCMRLERVGGHASDTYGADARLLEFDIHYEVDSFGSSQEYSK